MSEFQRARSREQKAERLSRIVTATGELFDQTSFEAVTMKAIAEQAGLKKASLYNYFQTKEEVFAQLFLVELDAWILEFGQRAERMRKPSRDRVATMMTDLLLKRARFSRLMSILSSVLERNISVEKLRKFKLEVLNRSQRMFEFTKMVLPKMGEAQIFDFQIEFHAVVAGLWPMAHPNARFREAIDVEPLRVYAIDFRTSCTRILKKLLEP